MQLPHKILFVLASVVAYGSVCAETYSINHLFPSNSFESSFLTLEIITEHNTERKICFEPNTVCYQSQLVSLEAKSNPLIEPDRAGLISDTKFFFFQQIAFLGFLYVSPESISGWSEEEKNANHFKNWRHNATHPEWDEDEWLINYVGHPYFGGVYFVRARERGFNRTDSFWYSAVLSLSWEMGLEALAEPVSIQDIIVTPVFGYYVGEYFMSARQRIKNKHRFERTTMDEWALFFTDPIGSINTWLRRHLGKTMHLEARLLSAQGSSRMATQNQAENIQYRQAQSLYKLVGLELTLEW